MKRTAAVILVLLMMSGCFHPQTGMDQAVLLREKILASQSCSFTAEVTADFGDTVYSFVMDCEADKEGNILFRVEEPESISGITGRIDASGGELTFDDQVLAFSMLADGELSPVSGPWLFLKALRSGYLTSCGVEEPYLRMTIDDSYESDAMQVDIWVNEEMVPVHADILWQGRRILTVSIENFQIL